MRALPGHTELRRDVRDRTPTLKHAPHEEKPPVNSETSITVGHRGLLAMVELSSSIKPEAPSRARKCHEAHGRLRLEREGRGTVAV